MAGDSLNLSITSSSSSSFSVRKGAELMKLAGYSGDDSAPFMKAAALLEAGKLSEAEVASAAEGTRQCEAQNPPAYFWGVLKHVTSDRIPDLNQAAKGLANTFTPTE